MSGVRIQFQMDDSYFREFHREWVAALGVRWRSTRRIAASLLVGAFVCSIIGWSAEIEFLTLIAWVPLASAIVVVLGLVLQRSAWLSNCRSLPWYGMSLKLEVRDGDLVQVKNYPGDPRFERTGVLVPTPNGYLVKYRGSSSQENRAVSSTEASLYIPHRLIIPPQTREAFLAALESPGNPRL